MGELVRAVECLNVPGDEMSDGIKQKRVGVVPFILPCV